MAVGREHVNKILVRMRNQSAKSTIHYPEKVEAEHTLVVVLDGARHEEAEIRQPVTFWDHPDGSFLVPVSLELHD